MSDKHLEKRFDCRCEEPDDPLPNLFEKGPLCGVSRKLTLRIAHWFIITFVICPAQYIILSKAPRRGMNG